MVHFKSPDTRPGSGRLVITAVVVTLVIVAGLGVLAARLQAGSSQGGDPLGGRKGAALGVGPLGIDVCNINNPATLGFVASLPAGAAAPVPQPRGIQAPLLAAPDDALDAIGLDRLYVSNVDTRADLPPDVTDVRPLTIQASDPDIHSCEFKLADEPAAVELRDRATSYLLGRGLISDEQVADPSTIWFVSDTVLPDGRIAMFTLVQKPSAGPFATEPNEKHEFLTVFSSKDGGIVGAAAANLYAAATIAPGDAIEPGTPGASPTPMSNASTPLPSPSAALVPVSSPTTTAPEP